jgi:hypothetical protein
LAVRSETRANVIFLAVLMALTLPGAIILFRKKLEPGARPMGAPDPVRRSTPYMDPAPVAGPVSRVVPPRTARWVASLAHLYCPSWIIPPAPVMSEHRSFELIGDSRTPTTRTITLLCWDETLSADFSHLKFTSPASTPVQTVHAELIPLPPQVRKELQEAGWPRPPHQVPVIQICWPPSLTPDPIRLSVGRPSGSNDPFDFVTLFTNPDAQSK